MRTLEELLTLFNPRGDIKGRWIYVLVRQPENGLTDDVLQAHELFFDENGGFEGITENSVQFCSETLAGYTQVLAMVQKDVMHFPILEWDEHQLIFNS